MPNFYEAKRMFGLADNFSAEDVNKTFRQMSKTLHPDKADQDEKSQIEATDAFKQLSAARDVLMKFLTNGTSINTESVYQRSSMPTPRSQQKKKPKRHIWNFNSQEWESVDSDSSSDGDFGFGGYSRAHNTNTNVNLRSAAGFQSAISDKFKFSGTSSSGSNTITIRGDDVMINGVNISSANLNISFSGDGGGVYVNGTHYKASGQSDKAKNSKNRKGGQKNKYLK